LNYISHYFIDGINGLPYYNLGLILPDLAGIFDRHLKLLDVSTEVEMTKTNHELYSGIMKHYQLDSIFHQSNYFVTYTGKIKHYFTITDFQHQPNRQHFLAHFLLELAIDMVIINREEGILNHFYAEFDKVEKQPFINFFNYTDTEKINGFYLFVDKFRAKRYLYNFVSADAVVFVIQKIQERIGLKVIDNQIEIDKLKKCIEMIASDISSEFDMIKKIRDEYISY